MHKTIQLCIPNEHTFTNNYYDSVDCENMYIYPYVSTIKCYVFMFMYIVVEHIHVHINQERNTLLWLWRNSNTMNLTILVHTVVDVIIHQRLGWVWPASCISSIWFTVPCKKSSILYYYTERPHVITINNLMHHKHMHVYVWVDVQRVIIILLSYCKGK